MVATANDFFGHRDLNLGDLSLASLVFAILAVVCNLLNCNPHVDRHFPFPPSWL